MTYGCSNSYGTNYGSASVSTPPYPVGTTTNTTTSFPSIPRTMYFPSSSASIPCYAYATDPTAFNIFQGPFTLAFMLRVDTSTSVQEVSPITFLSNANGGYMFFMRWLLSTSNWFLQDGSGTCITPTTWEYCRYTMPYTNKWVHVALTYKTGTAIWYFNGVASSSCSFTVRSTSVVP